MICWLILINLIVIVRLSQQISTPTSSNYVAGVVEFYPQYYGTAEYTLNNRTLQYISIIESEEAKNVDIIVFPEITLNSIETAAIIPRTEQFIVPCDNDNDNFKYMSFVRDISCAAKQTKKYVVINLTMQRNCKVDRIEDNDSRPCDNDVIYYNTNIVFDRYGAIISIYRKYNLMSGEPKMTKTIKPDHGIFETDFGVKFGHIICYDILHKEPSIDLIINDYGITDIIFPEMWFSELPFITAAQVQQNFAEKFNVNLLASGASRPSFGNTGSGIYAGKKGPLIRLMSPVPVTKLLVATVEKKLFTNNNNNNNNNNNSNNDREFIDNSEEENRIANSMSSLVLIKDPSLVKYSVEFLDFTNSSIIKKHICSTPEFCCDLHIDVTQRSNILSSPQNYYKYYAGVYYGDRLVDINPNYGILTCAIFACTNEDLSSCAQRFPNDTVANFQYKFNKINIELQFKTSKLVVSMPSTLNSKILPLYTNEYEYKEIGNYNDLNPSEMKMVSMKLKANSKYDLLTFGIHGRTYPFTN